MGMTIDEVIERLIHIKKHGADIPNESIDIQRKDIEALDMAIKALEQETVSRESYEHEYFLRKELESRVVILEKQIAEQEPKTEWIPVSECLPEEKENPITMDFYEYPCTVKFGDVYDVRYYKFGRGKWWHGAGTIDKGVVIAWQPLPKPYKEE